MMAKKSFSKYRAAVIGGGRVGVLAERESGKPKPATHVGAFLQHPKIELVGVAETNSKIRDQIKKYFPEIHLFPNARILLAKTKPDIVSIATPDQTHWTMVRLAVTNGVKLIICEKPISDNLRDAKKIVALCQKHKVILLVNHTRRFDKDLQVLGQEIRRGKFGPIQAAHCLYVNGLLNNGTHTIDLLRWYLGEVKWVRGWHNPQAAATHHGDYNVDAILAFANGSRVLLQSLDANKYYVFEQVFYGTKAVVKLSANSLKLEIMSRSDYRKKVTRGNLKRSFFQGMANHVIACLDGRVKSASMGEDALRTLEVLFALRRSAENGSQEVSL